MLTMLLEYMRKYTESNAKFEKDLFNHVVFFQLFVLPIRDLDYEEKHLPLFKNMKSIKNGIGHLEKPFHTLP